MNFFQYFSHRFAEFRRSFHDWRSYSPTLFASKVTVGRTACRYLFCQYQCPLNALASKARFHNLRPMIDQLTHILIKPNQIFSVLRLLAEPHTQRGYYIGPFFNGSEVIASAQMGLEQITSVLNYLALYAGLEILEHHPASVPPRAFNHEMVPLGFEAYAYWPDTDFRFRNNYAFDISLELQCSDDQIVGTLFSKTQADIKVHLETEIVQTLPQQTLYRPASQFQGQPGQVIQKGSDGYRLQIRRSVIQNQQATSTNIIGQRHYAPVAKIVLANE